MKVWQTALQFCSTSSLRVYWIDAIFVLLLFLNFMKYVCLLCVMISVSLTVLWFGQIWDNGISSDSLN